MLFFAIFAIFASTAVLAAASERSESQLIHAKICANPRYTVRKRSQRTAVPRINANNHGWSLRRIREHAC